MKILLIIFIVWSLAGILYFAIETNQILDDEATRNIDLPTPICLTLAYGPIYWIMACAFVWSSKFAPTSFSVTRS